MLNYIATDNTAEIIKSISRQQNILILYEQHGTTNISKYLKETKVNFNLIKYFIIDITCLDNSENEILENINNFGKLHTKIRIIILAEGFNDNSYLLSNLYNNGIYNIINSSDEEIIKQELKRCLSERGLQKKDVKRFENIEEIQVKTGKISNVIKLLKTKPNNKKISNKDESNTINKEKVVKSVDDINSNTIIQQSGSVYFFALFLEAITRLVKLICYIAVFVLTSIGITILLNSQLRNMVFQILGLK